MSWIGDAYTAIRSVWGAPRYVSRLGYMDGKLDINVCGRIRYVIREIME